MGTERCFEVESEKGRAAEDCGGWWLSSRCSSVAEHWLHKPGVMGVLGWTRCLSHVAFSLVPRPCAFVTCSIDNRDGLYLLYACSTKIRAEGAPGLVHHVMNAARRFTLKGAPRDHSGGLYASLVPLGPPTAL